MDPILIILVGMVAVIGGIIGFKMHPFFALLLGAFVVALLTPGSAIEQYALVRVLPRQLLIKWPQQVLEQELPPNLEILAGK